MAFIAAPVYTISFSALLRAENSEMRTRGVKRAEVMLFQCSSASRKFRNRVPTRCVRSGYVFQCSSASRKFRNKERALWHFNLYQFQCSSASRKFRNVEFCLRDAYADRISVLFCEPKIPKSCRYVCSSERAPISVLFCEQKIQKYLVQTI